ncbi:MAG: hypothetical protein JNK54_00075 [Elusimicrobia bacterium]|jgi:hypothetical protein|nr:hypothetical protein [Elusimicrobiota bacterium]
MKIEIFALCDAATEGGGKLNVLGAFDVIGVPELPLVHPSCAVAIRIRFKRIEVGAHRVKVAVVDEDGRPSVPPFETTVEIRPLEGDESSVANLILNFQQLRFDKFGRYSVDLAVDGRQEGALPIYVRQTSAPAERHLP